MGASSPTFFTTKEPGQGTGLGLFVAYEAASCAGGALTLAHSSPGSTRFELHLPLAPASGSDPAP